MPLSAGTCVSGSTSIAAGVLVRVESGLVAGAAGVKRDRDGEESEALSILLMVMRVDGDDLDCRGRSAGVELLMLLLRLLLLAVACPCIDCHEDKDGGSEDDDGIVDSACDTSTSNAC